MSEVLAGFEKLAGAKESLARTMGAAMGVEVRDEAKVRAPVLKPGDLGYDDQQEGLLRDAIYVAYDDQRALLTPDSYRYTVSWNSSKAPHGHWAEFGFEMPYVAVQGEDGRWFTPIPTRKSKGRQEGIPRKNGPLPVEARPFLGPAFDAKQPALMRVAEEAGARRLKELLG